MFGYGSLIWRPDFPFADRRKARITGWTRRFWQGSHDHRGTPDAPGRVVTLIPEPGAFCDGVAYLIDHDVFDHLDHREKNGYERNDVELQFDDARSNGVVYIAHRGNHAFLGPATTRGDRATDRDEPRSQRQQRRISARTRRGAARP